MKNVVNLDNYVWGKGVVEYQMELQSLFKS